MHGVYHEDGPRKDLHFKGALLQQDPETEDNYIAQFDALYLPEAYGWHSFFKRLFVNITGGEECDVFK